VALVRTDVSKKRISSISSVERMSELATTGLLDTAYVVPSSLIISTPMIEKISSSETSVLTKPTWHHIQEDVILHSHRHETLKSYIASISWTL
jgi:hypothetical protein